MGLNWQTGSGPGVIDSITDFRLNLDRATDPGVSGTRWWSAILGLENTSIDVFETRAAQHSPGDILVPNTYGPARRLAIEPEQFVTVFARAALLKAVNEVGNGFGVASVHLGGFVPAGSLNFDAPRELEIGDDIVCEKGAVLTAVIEDGIAFAHNLFRDGPESSRVQAIYILAAPAKPNGKQHVGDTWAKSDIDGWLKKFTTDGVLDEDQLYHKANLINFSHPTFSPAALHKSHGTHVMALAAGYDMDGAPGARSRPILCAILPPRVTMDTTGQSLLPYLKLALDSLVEEANRFKLPDGEPVPLVFNFSYGSFGGPHDGTGRIATVIRRKMKKRHGNRPGEFHPMVLPAGNGNLARIHARVDFRSTGPTMTLPLRVLPDDRTASHVEMWVPDGQSDVATKISVRVTPPGGPPSAPVTMELGSHQKLYNGDHQEIGLLSWDKWTLRRSRYRGAFVLSINPTANLDASEILAPAGLWQIDLAGQGTNAVEAWVQRDETLPGFSPNGRQAYFDRADYQRFDAFGAPLAVDPPDSDCPVRRTGTLNGFAAQEATLVIGGLTQSNGLMSDYSGTGPTHSKDHPQPDASARSDDSPALPGVLSAGSRSGSMVRMNGTSVAAPRVAGFIADNEKGSAAADRTWLRAEAAKSERNKVYPGEKPADNRTGAGRLDLKVHFRTP